MNLEKLNGEEIKTIIKEKTNKSTETERKRKKGKTHILLLSDPQDTLLRGLIGQSLAQCPSLPQWKQEPPPVTLSNPAIAENEEEEEEEAVIFDLPSGLILLLLAIACHVSLCVPRRAAKYSPSGSALSLLAGVPLIKP